jgi:(E)-4-hydroxy-3-methylbut-2-enyl-diphosphate synthase
LPELDKWGMNDLGVDYIYSGSNAVEFMLPNGLAEIIDYVKWRTLKKDDNRFPLLTFDQLALAKIETTSFLRLRDDEVYQYADQLVEFSNVILWLYTDNLNAMAALRAAILFLSNNGINLPVVIENGNTSPDPDQLMVDAGTEIGGLLIDGLGDGVLLRSDRQEHLKLLNDTAFGVLQAARTRITKTEYISCPSCGRTLFDLQETTAMIRKRTDHLKGLKIGIMGCIVKGPGEVADADYGYVGSGKGKITLYKGQEIMKKGVPSEKALDELIELIKSDGNWNEPSTT